MKLTRKLIALVTFVTIICSCKPANKQVEKHLTNEIPQKDTFKIYTQPSNLENDYVGFNSGKAINHIADIENEYFNNYDEGLSKYYGTQWLEKLMYSGDTLVFADYQSRLKKENKIPLALHCTHYAMEALKAGFGSSFLEVEKHHKKIWKDREYAGWSIGYILTKHFGWKAYLVVSDLSDERINCINNYKKDKKYHVWKQPNIPIEQVYDFDIEKETIDSVLSQNEFSWGFSNQGWHTWITRFDTLKECYWNGVPSKKYDDYDVLKPLFVKTKFTDYMDHHSHILVFPPKEKD